MPAFIEYLIKLSICLAVVYLFYQLFLRRLTFYNWNRWYLLGYSALSFIIPVIDIMPQLRKREMTEAAIIAWIPSWSYTQPESKNFFETLSYWDWAIIILILGSLFFLIRFLTRLYSFLLIKNKATLVTKHHPFLYQLNENINPFSFGNAIFINQYLHSDADLEEIIRHEFVHVKQNHTIDIVFAELLCITNWFNPFAWLIRHGIKQNLEFIADDKVVQNGFDKKEYQYLLLKVMGNKQFTFTNHFNFSNLKKRIAMMNTLKTAKVHLVKFLFLLPVVAVLLLSFRKEMQKVETPLNVSVAKDTIPDSDSGYKISVITTPGGFDNPKMNRTVIDRMSVEDWNKKKEFYEKKSGQGAPTKAVVQIKDGKTIKYDSVYVTRYKPKPIKPGEEPLVFLDGNEISYSLLNSIPPEEIKSVNVIKDASSISSYGEKGKYGAIEIITNNGYRPKGFKNTNPSNKTSKDKGSGISLSGDNRSLTILDGREISYEEFKAVKGENIKTFNFLEGQSATEKYGDKGKNGVIEMKSRNVQNKPTINISDSTKGATAFYRILANDKPKLFVDGQESTEAQVRALKPEKIGTITILRDSGNDDKQKVKTILLTTKDNQIVMTEKDTKIIADTLFIKS